VPLLKRARRARRRKGPPGDRVLGAWHEAVDRVAERGLPVTRASTTADVVRGAGVLLPTTAALAELGSLADRVAFSGIGVDESTALRAWTRADEVGAVIRRHASRRRRVMHHLDPRPLLSRGCHWSPPGRRRASGFTDAGPATGQP
jgi:hypothetical protein